MLNTLKTSFLSSFQPKSIPSLDGIRAISCLFVILGHFSYLYVEYFTNLFGPLLGPAITYSIGNQYTGVTFFFVLSGFLITNILIEEIKKESSVSYKNFFLKRLFRIFPAYYFYFILIFCFLYYSKITSYSNQDLIAAITYTYNYFSDMNPWFMGHFWSLAVEEQFYLIWPLLFIFTYKRYGIKVPFLIIVASPLIRIATYFLFEEMRGRISIMTHTRFDCLLFGCALAYCYQNNMFDRFNLLVTKFKLHIISAFHILFFSRLLQMKFQGKYVMTLGYSFDAFAMCILIIYLVKNKNVVTKVFNLPILVHIGSLSYSLYLWHIPFAWSELGSKYLIPRIIAIYLCALFSYLLIETPFMKLRKRFITIHS